MKVLFPSILIAIIFSGCVTQKTPISCDGASRMFNFSEIATFLKRSGNIDTFYIIADSQIASVSCKTFTAMDAKFVFVTDKSSIEDFKAGNWAVRFDSKCQYLGLTEMIVDRRLLKYRLIRLCENEFIDCYLNIDRGDYHLGAISRGAY